MQARWNLKIVQTLYNNIIITSLKTNTELHSYHKNESRMTEMSLQFYDAMLLLHETASVMVWIWTHEHAA